jgi:hypothetical protein
MLTEQRLPLDHPDRPSMSAEVHARPPMPVVGPARATYLTVRARRRLGDEGAD